MKTSLPVLQPVPAAALLRRSPATVSATEGVEASRPGDPPRAAEAVQSHAQDAAEGDPTSLEPRLVALLRTIHDPEIHVNIYDLGLIYGINIDDDAQVRIRMTLTAPACPVAGEIVEEVRSKVSGVEGVRHCDVELVWEPPWDKERISEAARFDLGLL